MAGLGDTHGGRLCSLGKGICGLHSWPQIATKKTEKCNLLVDQEEKGTEAVFVPLLGDSIFLQWLFMGSNFNTDGNQTVSKAGL